ncbi:histidinol-phosphate transaminase [Phormidesmis priestleyi ULC007]|uniref:Histidinol-phosphate aminotransferase n=1 Tax=Phormidesmis priestleyi ULC007 TaxID=1920490 RepID=A0A2T1DMQ5_9CYAN|nr:histidinol-phosphate transaminase [Phormidesmis priestleyi]PSB21742.1 histidinol-phosphate transaminase [Phormidesmis priestleyi ULC007]PZO54691.1 MAG: histidinol-phosphate transaminase [Phormidesmis priestleyi]
MLEFIRSDLAQLAAYNTQHTDNSQESKSSEILVDRVDVNESPYDLPDELKQKLSWTYQQAIENNRYPDGGYESLKRAIADYVNESANNITAANISIGNGSDELIRSLLIATCIGGEGSILVADPTFSMYRILAQTLGVSVVTIGRSLTNFEMDLTEAQTAIAVTQTPPIRAVFVVHPNSPTGNALTFAELSWLRSLPQNILVAVDEAYFEFSQTSVADELLQHPNWVILRTFSKAFRLAAHRVGYAIADPELITALEKVRLPYNLSSFTQAAALVAVTHRRQLLSTISLTLTERTRLTQALSQHPEFQVWESAANFVYLRLKNADANEKLATICQTLKDQGTLIRHTGNGLRISIGTPEENQRTIARFKKVSKY